MSNILAVVIFAVMVILGVGSSVAIVGYMLWIIMQKIYRMIRYGKTLYQ